MIKKIQQITSHYGLNQKEFADKIGASTANITEWFKGRSKPKTEAITKICEVFGINANWLLLDHGTMLLTDSPAPDLPPEDAALLADIKDLIAKHQPKTKAVPNHAAPGNRPAESLAKDKPLIVDQNVTQKGKLLTDLHKVTAKKVAGHVAAGYGGHAEDWIEEIISADKVLGKAGEDVYSFTVVGDSMLYGNIIPGDLVMVCPGLLPRLGDLVLAKTTDGLTVKKYEKDSQGRLVLHPENYHYPDIIIDPTVEIIGVITTAVRVIRD